MKRTICIIFQRPYFPAPHQGGRSAWRLQEHKLLACYGGGTGRWHGSCVHISLSLRFFRINFELEKTAVLFSFPCLLRTSDISLLFYDLAALALGSLFAVPLFSSLRFYQLYLRLPPSSFVLSPHILSSFICSCLLTLNGNASMLPLPSVQGSKHFRHLVSLVTVSFPCDV